MNKKDGMNYAPKGIPLPVVAAGDFQIGVIGLDHGHIYGMCNGLSEAGADIALVYDPDKDKLASFIKSYPGAKAAKNMKEIINNPKIQMIASACIPNERADLGVKAMKAGKDYFADKAAVTTMDQLARVKAAVKETGRRFFVYFGERLHVEAAVYAGELIEQGAIGKVIQVTGFGPHKIGLGKRPDWFYEKEKYGGILCDIGSHQLEQFLYFSGAKDASIVSSHIGNYSNPDHPGLDDYGDMILVGDNGTSGYFRLDWFTPDGLSTWGDGRIFILGKEGTIELRKYLDVARTEEGDHVFLVNKEGEYHFKVNGKVGFPFFGDMILDCLNQTENAMTQDHILKACELAVLAQEKATKLV